MTQEKSFFRKFILTCNPWFLSSTIVLLLGIYSLYSDPQYENLEEQKVLFSFFSLQFYQFLALGTVFFFRKLKLFHDSVMLIVIGSLLLLVPFINLSYAAQVGENESFSFIIGLSVALLSLLNLSALKVFYRNINLPPLLICTGVILILANFLVPLTMNTLHLDINGNTHEFMGIIWKYGVPLIAFAAYFTLFKVQDGKLLFERKWLPVAILSCWVAVSLVNFISINFVYSVDFKFEYIGLIGFIAFHIVRLMYINKGSELDTILLWIVSLFPFVLREELPVHFSVMLMLNAYLLFTCGFSRFPLFIWNILALSVNLSLDLSTHSGSHYQFILITSMLFATFFAFKDRSYEKSLLAAVLYIFAVKAFDGELTFLTYFEALSVIVLNMVFWPVERVIKERYFITGIILVWMGLGVLVQMTGLYYNPALMAIFILNIAVARMYLFNLYIPKTIFLCCAFLLTGEFVFELFDGMSRSMMITMLSFIIFGLGVFMTSRKAMKKAS